MAETLVDLGYRGVTFVKRVKLVQVRPASGFIELSAPMPVGTRLALADDALTIPAVVTRVREQVAGASGPVGMIVAPMLEHDAARAWWEARVELPAEPEPAARSITAEPTRAMVAAPVASAPRTTAPMAAVAAPMAAPMAAIAAPQDAAPQDRDVAGAAVAAALVAATRASPAMRPSPAAMVEDDHSKRTTVMDAVTAGVLAEISASDSGEKIGVDDGPRTEAMAAVDLRALGLDVSSSSGRLPGVVERATTDVDPPTAIDDEPSEPHDTLPDPGQPSDRPSSPGKRKRKKR
jgi:hypothetical protein